MAQQHPDDSMLNTALLVAIKAEIDAHLEQAVVKAQEELGRVLRAKVGELALTIMSKYSIERHGKELIIRVETEEGIRK